MKRLLFLLFALPMVASAQEVLISGNDYTGCIGFLVDSGASAADYGANENHTITICAQDPETVINLYWNICSLGAGDQLSIFDGPNTGSPLIGTYTGFELQSLDIFNSEANTSGCLTVQFTSDANGNGNFAAEITCGYPCERPFAIVETGLDNPALICPGETVTFNAATSTVANGFEIISWEWDFGDGTTESSTGPVVTHTYTTPGAYRLELELTDNNECSNNNQADILLFVSTDPDFTGTSTDIEVCVGQEVDLTGVVTGVTWDAQPDANLGGALFIPDDQSQCFDSELTFSSFTAGQTVTDPSDFVSLFMNFEHSFMGDLVLSLICPNGQSMVLHQQGGGGTYLGEPVDLDNLPNDPGVGYDYWFAPDAPNGTWTAESGNFTTLPSGTYSTVQPWTILEGCPLNGTWTLEICDLWGSDNGFIFDWGLFFNPELYPELITFTPTFGEPCDSTFWEGPSIIGQSPNCNVINVQPTEVGTEVYTFTGINNHGCSYETTVNVVAVQGPIAQTPEVLYFCGNPVTLNGSISNPIVGTSYTYSWNPSDLLNNANVANPTVQSLDEPTFFTLTVAPSAAPECASTSDVLVNIPIAPTPILPDTVFACVGQAVGFVGPAQSVDWQYTYAWVNLDFSNDVISTVNNIEVTSPGSYQLTTTMNAPCSYTTSGIVVAEFQVCELGFIPNIISPNGDDVNNSFTIEGLEFFNNSTLKVYNRWGTLVFESENYKGNWSPREEEASDGTYFYILGVNFPTGMEYFNGPLTIVR